MIVIRLSFPLIHAWLPIWLLRIELLPCQRLCVAALGSLVGLFDAIVQSKMPVGVFHVPFSYDAFFNVGASFGRFKPLTLYLRYSEDLLHHQKTFWPWPILMLPWCLQSMN